MLAPWAIPMNFRIHRQPEQEEGPKVTLLDLAAALVRAVAKWFPDSQANYQSDKHHG